MTPQIARWRMMEDSEGDYCMERWNAGDLVKYADHVAALRTAEATNAELLRLLERHHIAWMAEGVLYREDTTHYSATQLCEHTEAAIAAAKDAYGLGDPLRTRVPVWRCPVCAEKFYSREHMAIHRTALDHGPKS